MTSAPTPLSLAARAFRAFFAELRAVYLEREALFTQVELALLCREHVLVVGPPGTAKSAIAAAVLGRIVDEATGAPSLFAKQLSESTVQTDLVGPVDFKVLTETGRTEYRMEEGMLGATHAFLDEVFDGRDMLLRSILNVLYERELKQGRTVTAGRTETVLMTSNRYLSEVLARSPELLLAFADRLGFVSFVPHAFVHPESRAAMLRRFSLGRQPRLSEGLTLQQLRLLQDEVERVEVPARLLEALELLADELERLLAARTAKLPDLVPTKYFSQRSLVKALWVLKAAVVRDAAVQHPERERTAGLEDLEALRAFFLLGGPSPSGVEALLRGPLDARERTQLELVRLEHRAFDEAMARVRAELGEGAGREARALHAEQAAEAADALSRAFEPGAAVALARLLRTRLIPGPRYAENRAPLLASARALLAAAGEPLTRPPLREADAQALTEVLTLAREVPELEAAADRLAEGMARGLAEAFERLASAAEGAAFEPAPSLERLTLRARELHHGLEQLRAPLGALPESLRSPLEAQQGRTRERGAAALARCAEVAAGLRTGAADVPSLSREAGHLAQLEAALVALAPSRQGLAAALLAPLAQDWARRALEHATFTSLGELGRTLLATSEGLRRLGLEPGSVLSRLEAGLTHRLLAHAQLPRVPRGTTPPGADGALDGRAYAHYRECFGESRAGAELAALPQVEAHVGVDPEVRGLLARAALAELEARLLYLTGWLAQLRAALLSAPASAREAVDGFDRLVHSRLPLLLLREGELARLHAALALVRSGLTADDAALVHLQAQLAALTEDFHSLGEALLPRPAGR